MQKVKCAVLGATGVVGQHFLKLLTGHPFFELAAICASDARTGKKLAEMKEHIAAIVVDICSPIEGVIIISSWK